MDVLIKPRRIVTILAIGVAIMAVGYMLALISIYYLGHNTALGLVPLFHLGRENNFPTFFTSGMLLMSAAILAFASVGNKRRQAPYVPHWIGLAVIFFYLSIDEAASLHERLIQPTRDAINASGFLFYAWIVPYSLILVIFVLAYLRFLIHLPRRTRNLFIVAGAIYVLGAIGFESIGGRYYDLYGRNNIVYNSIEGFEEILEMIGVVIFIHALLTYIGRELPGLRLGISAEQDQAEEIEAEPRRE